MRKVLSQLNSISKPSLREYEIEIPVREEDLSSPCSSLPSDIEELSDLNEEDQSFSSWADIPLMEKALKMDALPSCCKSSVHLKVRLILKYYTYLLLTRDRLKTAGLKKPGLEISGLDPGSKFPGSENRVSKMAGPGGPARCRSLVTPFARYI